MFHMKSKVIIKDKLFERAPLGKHITLTTALSTTADAEKTRCHGDRFVYLFQGQYTKT